jgi:hypothetical protein
LKEVNVFQNPDEDFLNKIFARDAISGKPAEKLKEGVAMPAEEDFHLVDPAFSHGHHELFAGLLYRHHR